MATPITPLNPAVNFQALAARALTCCQEWRKLAQREPKDSAQARRAFEVAALFEKQAGILAAMHRNRTEWKKPTQSDFTIPAKQPEQLPAKETHDSRMYL
jgi:DNA-binding SARP family transcriptional activator